MNDRCGVKFQFHALSVPQPMKSGTPPGLNGGAEFDYTAAIQVKSLVFTSIVIYNTASRMTEKTVEEKAASRKSEWRIRGPPGIFC